MVDTSSRRKICWYCEGSVPYSSSQCAYCGSDLSDQELKQESPVEKRAHWDDEVMLDHSLASRYKPPYLARERFSDEEQQVEAKPPYKKTAPKKSPTTAQAGSQESRDAIEAEKDVDNKDALSLLLLSLGGFLMTLGLLLFFFAEEGVLILKWNANYWFVYCFLSLPLLYFGFRYLGSLNR